MVREWPFGDWLFKVVAATVAGVVVAVVGVLGAVGVGTGLGTRASVRLPEAAEAVLLGIEAGALLGVAIGVVGATAFVLLPKWRPWASFAAVGAIALTAAVAAIPFDVGLGVAILGFTAAVLVIGELATARLPSAA